MGDMNNQRNDIGEIRRAMGNPDGYSIISLPDDYFKISPQNANSPSIMILDFGILGRHNLYFCNCTFDIETVLIETSKAIRFDNCSFMGKIQCVSDIQEVATFYHTTFEDDAFFRRNFEKGANFSKSIFRGRAVFSAAFRGEANFRNVIFHEACFNDSNFQKVNFSDAEFLHRAEFQDSHFNEQALFTHTTFQQASFRGSIFDGNAYFFEAKFLTIPDFLQVSFNKNINFTNTELDFGFDEAKEKIEEIYQNRIDEYNREENRENREEPERYKIANEFRDSFRNIKSPMIEKHNLLDASNYHRVELYYKELELGYKKEKSTRDIVDRIHLMLYRLTSDHHTDLLLILNNVLGLIVLFGAFVCGLCYFASYDTKCVDYECCTSAEVYYLHSLMINSFCVDCNVWSIFCLEAFLIMLVCCAFVVAFILLVFFFNYVNSICRELGYWFVAFFVFVLFILAVKPAIMLPIFGKLIDESLKIDFPAFTSLSIVYAILMFLLVFSLQKTARKNTIVPN